MHEIRFANEILSVLKEKLDKDSVSGEVVVNARLSPFSHVTAECLQGSFKELARGGGFESVRLKIMPLEILLECKDCKRTARITKKVFGCPSCGSSEVDIRMEREFFVESIEIENKEKGVENGD